MDLTVKLTRVRTFKDGCSDRDYLQGATTDGVPVAICLEEWDEMEATIKYCGIEYQPTMRLLDISYEPRRRHPWPDFPRDEEARRVYARGMRFACERQQMMFERVQDRRDQYASRRAVYEGGAALNDLIDREMAEVDRRIAGLAAERCQLEGARHP